MKTTIPHVLPKEDCQMVVHTKEATCYIMDTCCRGMTEHQLAEIDRKIAHICQQAAVKKACPKNHIDD